MADTVRVNLCYRPLRIGWAVRADDLEGFRRAVRYSHVLWGGRFNPILIVDNEEEARQQVELFRLDVVWPLGDSLEVREFAERFPHLKPSFHGGSIFVKQARWRNFSRVLDIFNTAAHWHNKPEWTQFKDMGLCKYEWQGDDPLADVFLMQFGRYPDVEEVGVDYAAMVEELLDPITVALQQDAPIPGDFLRRPSLSSVCRFAIGRHYTVRPGWETPGFFIGDAGDLEDLICYWNIRACDVPLWFLDTAHLDRYAGLIPQMEAIIQEMAQHSMDADAGLGVWSRGDAAQVDQLFENRRLIVHSVGKGFWSGSAVVPPVMRLGEASTLGVIGSERGVPRVSFALTEKPYHGHPHYMHQHLVASVSLIGGLFGDQQHTFHVPYVPELNHFYARTMHFEHDKLRVEPEQVGLIIDAADHDAFLNAMPVAELIRRIFALAGYNSTLSNSGRIARQLLTQLGGLQGARVFKIPGARELLRSFGPRATFSREVALATISGKTSEELRGTFGAHVDLFLGPRPIDQKLTPPHVFAAMVDAGLFRIGVDLDCPQCGMRSWVALDVLKQQISCELCGHDYDATGQLLASEWRFRRSGVLGAERNAQGAIPVVLTLQQLDANLDRAFSSCVYSPSIDLKPRNDPQHPDCEVDFVWVQMNTYPKPTSVILGECKDRGRIEPDEFRRDVENLRRIADAFPSDRFQTYVAYIKLAPFTKEEIAIASVLNDEHRRRVILLSARELEPYHLFERVKAEHGIGIRAHSCEELALITHQLYFTDVADDTIEP
ncbi:hypothetical protein [Xanthomonas sp. 1678]|uniref:hypothetical protein n=1 Tax=Xanthomonas sp. 1678 TaxID=3158788 RepID=UPI002861ECF3|nr:hypothetical protein [Xanthomonas translucens]